MKYFIGIDNSKLTHSVSIIDENGKLLKDFEVENNKSGFEKLRKTIKKYENVVIAFELPHGPLIDFLRKEKYKLYSLNPLKIKRFKEAYTVSGNKSDKVDSLAIAQYIKYNEENCRELIFNSSEIETLKILSISHDRMTIDHARYVNRLIFILREYFPLYDGLFSTSAPKILLKMLIKYPIWSVLKHETEEIFIDFLISNNYRSSKYIQRLQTRIKNYQHCVMPEVETALSLEAMSIARILLMIKDQIDQVEKKMAEITMNHPLGKILNSLPGAGLVLTSKLLGILGDNKKRFSKANNVQTLFGTAPMNYQSGGYHKVIMRKACNKRGKNILFVFAFSSLKYSKWARNYYDRQRNLGKKHSVAVRALSNKWLKIIFSMWKNNTFYEAERIISKAA